MPQHRSQQHLQHHRIHAVAMPTELLVCSRSNSVDQSTTNASASATRSRGASPLRLANMVTATVNRAHRIIHTIRMRQTQLRAQLQGVCGMVANAMTRRWSQPRPEIQSSFPTGILVHVVHLETMAIGSGVTPTPSSARARSLELTRLSAPLELHLL